MIKTAKVAKMSKGDEGGYKSPPRHSRFKKGQSGNPKGRPPGAKNFKTDLAEELQEVIAVREGNRAIKISKQRAIIKALVAKTLRDDGRAAAILLNAIFKHLNLDAAPTVEESLSATEEAIFEGFRKRVQVRDQGEVAGGSVSEAASEHLRDERGKRTK